MDKDDFVFIVMILAQLISFGCLALGIFFRLTDNG